MIEVRVAGIPALAEVTYYVEPEPMRITGTGFGDAEPPVQEEVEFTIRDRKGYKASWLENKLEDEKVYRDVEEQVLTAIHKQEYDP